MSQDISYTYETRKLDMRTLYVLTKFAENNLDWAGKEPQELRSAIQNAKYVMEKVGLSVEAT